VPLLGGWALPRPGSLGRSALQYEDGTVPGVRRKDAYPSLHEAAIIVGVDLDTFLEEAGALEVLSDSPYGGDHVSPTAVLKVGVRCRRRDTSEMATDLYDVALAKAPSFAKEVEREVSTFLGAEGHGVEPEHPFARGGSFSVPGTLPRDSSTPEQ
jgi:hypothetical protein